MELQKRKQIRLKNYDSSLNGAYFVTVCTKNRAKILSMIRRGDPGGRPEVRLSQLGRIAVDTLFQIEERFSVTVDCYVVMPDHVHFVIFLMNGDVKNKKLGEIVGAFKSLVSVAWLKQCKMEGRKIGELWQRGYYDHVVRNEHDLYEIKKYIEQNPAAWLIKMMMCCNAEIQAKDSVTV